MFQPTPLRDPDEPLSAKSSEREEVLQDVVDLGLVERGGIEEGWEADSGDFLERGTEVEGWGEEGEEERVENSVSGRDDEVSKLVSVGEKEGGKGAYRMYDLRLHLIQASATLLVLKFSDLRLSSIANIGPRRTTPGS